MVSPAPATVISVATAGGLTVNITALAVPAKFLRIY